MEELLTVLEAADLEGVSRRAIFKRVQQSKLQAVQIPANTSGKGYEYRISLSDLSAKAQARYYREQHMQDTPPKPTPAERLQDKLLESLTDGQRKQAAHWRRVLDEWRTYIAAYPKQGTVKTQEFLDQYNRWHPDMPLTERTLRHKWKLYRDFGEVALADGRADRADKGKTSIPDTAWRIFLDWWLDQGQPTVLYCYNLLAAWAKLDAPYLLPLPAVDSFYRETKKIPKGVIGYFRYGNKKFENEALPYVHRMYEDFDSNDVWVADYHTLDIFVRDEWTGKAYRPHVVVWQDIRSRKVLSMQLCESSNSDGVVNSFRKAIEKHGIPKAIYLDNGREFLVSDFGGRGKRKKDANAKRGATILERLQVEMVNAQAGNPRAKIIERTFRVLKEQFSRLFTTYTGGRPDWKPERLDGVRKRDKEIPLESDVRNQLETWLEGWYNMRESDAAGLGGRTPNACYDENLITKRTATKEQLNLMLLRSAKSQSVDRNGVYLKFGDIKLWFYHTELIFHHLDKPVFVRYNPENLSSVRIYNEDDQFLLVAERREAGGYGGEQDLAVIKKVAKLQKEQRDLVTGFKDELAAGISIEVPDALDAMQRVAKANIEQEQRAYEAKVLEPVRYEEQRPALAAGAEGDNLVELSRMNKNARKTKGE